MCQFYDAPLTVTTALTTCDAAHVHKWNGRKLIVTNVRSFQKTESCKQVTRSVTAEEVGVVTGRGKKRFFNWQLLLRDSSWVCRPFCMLHHPCKPQKLQQSCRNYGARAHRSMRDFLDTWHSLLPKFFFYCFERPIAFYVGHMCGYRYIHAHTYTYVNTSTYVHTYVHTDKHIHTYIYIWTHTYTHTYIHTYTHIQTYRHTYMHTYIHTRARAHTHTHTHTHICMFRSLS